MGEFLNEIIGHVGLYWGNIKVILGQYRDNAK